MLLLQVKMPVYVLAYIIIIPVIKQNSYILIVHGVYKL
jgi:hypothetical protein